MFLGIDMTMEYTCGGTEFVFSGTLPFIVSAIVTIIKIAVPVLLIIFGMIDLMKAVIASKEDEIKKGQQTLIKRIIAAILVFFVIQIVQMIIRFIAPESEDGGVNIANCFNCFVNGSQCEPRYEQP